MPPRPGPLLPSIVNINELSTGVAEDSMEPRVSDCASDVAVAGFLNKVGCPVFLIDVILDDSYKQILRRYSDFVALKIALERFQLDKRSTVRLPPLPSFKLLFPRVQQRGESVFIPQLDMLTQYCKALIELSDYLDQWLLIHFFSPSDFDTQLRRLHLADTQSQATFDFLPEGADFKKCMVIGDYFHASNFGVFDSKAGEMLACVGCDSDKWSLVGRTVKGTMQLGWVPPNYTIDIPDDEEDSMMDDIQQFIHCVETTSNTNEDTFLYPKYQVIQKFQMEEGTPSKVVDLVPGSLVIVIDQDEDGWWYVSSDAGEGWYPSTMLKLHSSSVAVNVKELDVICPNSESSQKCHHSDIFYTLREYTAEKDDELSFGQGMPLKVIQKSKSGWWTVRCSGKVGLCPAVYLSKSFPSKKLAFQRSTLQHASTIYGFPTNISPPQPTFQRSHSIRKSPERNHSHTIGFNASQTKIPPPRKRQELVSNFDDKRARKDSLNPPNKQAFRMKMTNTKELLSTVAKRFKELSKKRQSASRGEGEPSQLRRVSTHVSAAQVHPTESPKVDRSSWFEESGEEQHNPSIPSRFANKLSPYPNRPSKQQDSPVSKRASTLTGSLPGSPVSKRVQHKGANIPQRFLGPPSCSPITSKPMSPVPSRFFQ